MFSIIIACLRILSCLNILNEAIMNIMEMGGEIDSDRRCMLGGDLDLRHKMRVEAIVGIERGHFR